ncbi:unnamed protein product [Rotaria sordida]|uniref:Wax synthase domain-containing protein n=2 Tax=Rotaria sordida TaxID=392033 RepID=A0A819Q9A7_9BILA|nr:unnamed protein product [Rotaria sordida]CAF4020910.1 unnamed protein product [Rotaria sordida]
MISICLCDLTMFSREKCLTFHLFLLKTLWILFPLLPSKSKRDEWTIKYYFLLILLKLIINHWMYRWTMNCETRISYERIFMFYITIMTISYVLDIQIVLVRILTRDKYTVESFTNFPWFSLSLREIWDQRYNRIVDRPGRPSDLVGALVDTVLKESIFEPIRSELSSSTIAGLTTFLISSLLHVHIVVVSFHDLSYVFYTFIFFVLHGIVCGLEANMKIQFPEHVGWLLTHTFLLLTASFILGPLILKGSPFFMLHPPPFYNNK